MAWVHALSIALTFSWISIYIWWNSETDYYITMGHDIIIGYHYDVTMSNDDAWHHNTYNGIARSWIYYLLLKPIMMQLFP